jgi:predicted nucleic acid-binding protein
MSLQIRSRTTPLRAEPVRPLRGVLDTNVVIHWPLLDLSDLPREAAITAVTLAELAAGVHAARTDRDRAQRLDLLQRVESAFDPLPFDVAAARAYGRIASAVRSAGRSPRARVADQMIAAIAASRRLSLYTTNIEDFVGLDDVVTVVPVLRP